MPLAYSDVTQLSSLTLAIAAIGIGIDGVMVPRLERFRDYILNRSSEILDQQDSKNALELGSISPELQAPYMQIKFEFDALQSIRDDLEETLYFEELSSRLFLGGSIARPLVLSMTISALILLWATFINADYISSYCLPPNATIRSICSMDLVAIPSMLLVAYLVCCFVRYLNLWHRKLTELAHKRVAVKDSSGNLKLTLQLLKALQSRETPPAGGELPA